MTMSGMNVAEIRRVGARFAAEADTLERLQRSIDGTVRTAQQQWRGPDVELFAHGWGAGTRAQLSLAVAGLRALRDTAVRNAQEQEQASSLMTSMISGQIKAANAVAGEARVLSKHDSLNDATRAVREVDDALYDSGLKSLYGALSLGEGIFPGLARDLKSTGGLSGGAWRGVGTVGSVLGWYGLATDSMKFVNAVHQKDVNGSIYAGADMVADVLKKYGGPVGRLGGIAISTWNWNCQAALDLDWDWNSETNRMIRDPANFNRIVLGIDKPSSNPAIYTGQVAASVGRTLWTAGQRVASFF